MATTRKKARQETGRSIEQATAPIEYIAVTAENARADVRRAYEERKGVLLRLTPAANLGKAFSEALEDLIVEIGLDPDVPPLVAIRVEDDRPSGDAVTLTEDGVDEQMRRSREENRPIVVPREVIPAYEAWQARNGQERRRTVAARRTARAI